MRYTRKIDDKGRLYTVQFKDLFKANQKIAFKLMYNGHDDNSRYHPFILATDIKYIDEISSKKEYKYNKFERILQKSKFKPRLSLNKDVRTELKLSKPNLSIEIINYLDKTKNINYMEIWNSKHYHNFVKGIKSNLNYKSEVSLLGL